MGLAGIVSIVALIAWHTRKTKLRHRRHSYIDDQKTNNENEDNIRRYRNPLFGTDKGGGGGGGGGGGSSSKQRISATELRDINIEKYEKSPRRKQSPTDSTDFNDYRESASHAKTSHKKDINIEIDISRTLTADREVIV